MRRMPQTARRTIAALLLVMLTAVGCGRGGGDGELPAAAELLAAAADEMAAVQSTRLVVETDTDVSGLPVRKVEGVLTRSGEAEGTAQIEQMGVLMEVSFVLVGDTFHYKLIGGWQQLPLSQASTLYDPSAILDGERGVPHLLRTVTDGEVEARETVAGVQTYRVRATLPGDALGVVLPGIDEPVPGTLWIGVDRPLLHRVEFTLTGAAGSGTATVTLSDFDAPVEISAP